MDWISANFCGDEEQNAVFLRQLMIACRERPLNILLYCDIVRSLALSTFTDILTRWVDTQFRFQNFTAFQPHVLFFIEQLIQRCLVNGSFVGRCVHEIGYEYYNELCIRSIAMVYFAVELGDEREILDMPPEFVEQVRRHVTGYQESWIEHSQYRDDHWALWKEKITDLFFKSPIVEALARDDLTAFQQLTVAQSFEVDQKLPLCVFLPFKYLQHSPPLVGIAAFFNANDCFDNLVIRGADLRAVDDLQNTVAQFAAAGGSAKILRTLSAKKLPLNGTLQVAAGFSRMDIFEWILGQMAGESEREKIDDVDLWRSSVLCYAAIENNIPLLKRCFECRANINVQDDINYKSPLFRAIDYGSFEAVQMLLSVGLVA
jgi:hypothetical protein